MRDTIRIDTPGRGLHEITRPVARVVEDAGIREGQCHCFIRHTSASLGTLQSLSAQPRCILSAPSCKAEGERQ